MSDPFLVGGPALISFSGGRSSGMLLARIVEAHRGALPTDVVVAFANTGKEREETLAFVDRLGRHLGVEVRWLEYGNVEAPEAMRWRLVSFATASRDGEPFAAMIKRKAAVPNPMIRSCTYYLKNKTLDGYMRSLGFASYSIVAGIRADEPLRVARMRARQDTDFELPLAEAGVGVEEVLAFWRAMPFDLALPTIGGATVHGNCDLCFLKGPRLIRNLIHEEPTRADWWARMEQESGRTFRNDRPSYAVLKREVLEQPGLFDDIGDEAPPLPCECTE